MGRWLSGLLVSVAAVSGLITLVDPHVPALSLLVLYILVVLPVAVVGGTGLAVVASILSVVVFAYLFVPPIHSVRVAELRDLAGMVVFLVTAVVVGELAARSRREAQQLAGLSEEQSALRRVATLAARGVRPVEIFSAVSDEVGRLFGSEQAAVGRFEPDGSAVVVVGVSEGIRGV